MRWLLCLLFLTACAAQKPSYHEDWPALHQNNQRYPTLKAGPVPPLKEAWSFQTKGRLLYPPIAVNGTVYLGSRDSHLYAIDAATGTQKWKTPVEVGGLFSSPAFALGKLYGGRWNPYYHIYSWDATTGKELWQKRTGDLVNRPPWVLTAGTSLFSHEDPPVGAPEDQKIVQTGWTLSESTEGADTTNPVLRWKTPLPGIPKTAPAYANETLFVALDNQFLYALAADTGKISWQLELAGEPASAPLIQNQTLFLTTRNGYIYAVNTRSGELRWRYQFVDQSNSPLRGDLALAKNQLLIPAERMLFTFDINNREPGWKYRFPGLITAPVVSKEHVYLGSSTRALYVMDREKGYIVASYVTPGEILASPILLQGKVLVAGADGKLYAFEEEPRPQTKKVEQRRPSNARW